MQEFDISWIAILKIMGAGAFAYVVLPALLVVRDLLLHKAIGKWILTDRLNSTIRMCENDRWYLNNKYNKSFEMSFGSNSETYKIDDETVDKDVFLKYKENRDFHLKRFQYADAEIGMKHNLITWLTRHYKQADGNNPIPHLRAKHYDSAGPNENA